MKFVWNGELKKLCVWLTSVSLFILLICNMLLAGYRTSLNREFHQAFAALVGGVMEAYPDTSEEELILVLNGRGNAEAGERVLRMYGIFGEKDYLAMPAQNRRTNVLQWEMNLVLLGLSAGLLAGVFYYLSRRQNRIQTMCSYMEELVRGNYELDIEDNRDDELSGLKNEV